MIIAIDGPGGAGKTTLAKMLAAKLNFIYLDTGAMYRAVALAVIQKGAHTLDEEAVLSTLEDIDLNIDFLNESQQVYLNGENVSDKIRNPEVSIGASDVSRFRGVRLKLVELQREISHGHDVVLDGRDIGTFVFPNADFKFFLVAPEEVRAGRRFRELVEKGVSITFEDALADLKYRDENDSKREFAPLKPANDAKIINTADMSLEQVLELLCRDVLGDGKG